MKAEATQITATCEKHGDFLQKKINLAGFEIGKGECPLCAEERQARENQRKAEEAEKQLEQRRQYTVESFSSLIPPRFIASTFENYNAIEPGQVKNLGLCMKYAANFADMRRNGAGLIMCGTPGTGKTHLAIATGKEIAKKGYYVEYRNLYEIIREIRDTWHDDTKHESHVMGRYQSKDLLIIDEVGVQMGSESERNLIFEIINRRSEQILPTIILSNLARPDIAKLISERSVDRITDGGGGTIVFNWGSYRNQTAAA